MKFSTALTSLLLIPLLTGEVLGAATLSDRARGGKNKGGNKGAGAAQNSTATAAANSTAAAGAAAANNTAAAGAAAANNTAAAGAGAAAANSTAAANTTVLANNGAGNNNNNNGNPQTSTTLNPGVICQGFAQNGQQTPVAGQVASLTSTNNFINFCLTVNKPLTNGQQVKGGSCNPAPMGVIAASTNMPSSKFVSPVNGQNFQPNTAFNIQMAVNNLQTGNFVNAQANYYSAPQQVNAQGNIIGHTHFTVQAIPSFTSTTPLDSSVFAFFKGVNGAAQNGVVSEAVTAGLPAGTYRVCSINTDANHTPCLVAVAQHGSLDDCVYFSVGGNNNNVFAGNGAAGNAAGAAGNATGAAGAAGNAAGAAGAAAGAAGAANNATGAAGAANNATGAAGAAGNATSSAAAASTAAAGKGGKGAGAKGNGGRKAGGRRVQSRLGRDY